MPIIPIHFCATDYKKTLNYLFVIGCIILPAALLGTLFYFYSQGNQQLHVPWVPSLGINFSLRLDGLSMLFASLISGIGFLVQLYASAYMRKETYRVKFHVFLTLFMLSMLGLVLADNIMLLFVFWELTTIFSYLLIGFNHQAATARKNALHAMLLTSIGALVMLAGLIMLGEIAGSYRISIIIDNAASLSLNPWFIPSMLCIIAGAFTKSAQWPFHFWLPGAMAAPTPVSAYLHSATMVKAGVFLLARLLPVYGQQELWQWLLCTFGAVTTLWCALLAYKQTDLKLMLAYSTNVILGQLVLLLGIGSSYAVTAALLLIAAHSLYKAGLFMVIGNIDKAAGTREYQNLAGLKPVLTISFVAAVITGASKAGLPPSFGFISKEYIYKAGLEFGTLLSLLMLIANAIMVALSLVILIKPFLASRNQQTAPLKPVEQQPLLWLPPLLLAILSIITPIILIPHYQALIINPAANAMLNTPAIQTISLWQGINLPLMLSVVTLLAGIILYRAYPYLSSKIGRLTSMMGGSQTHFERLITATLAAAKTLTQRLQHDKLSAYSLQFFLTLACLLWLATSQVIQRPTLIIQANYYEIILAIFLIISAFVVVKAQTLLLSVAALATIGFLTTLIFLMYSAPDVAKTQLLVETLIVVFIAVVLRYLPRSRSVSQFSKPRRLLNATVAAAIGFSVGFILWIISASEIDPEIANFYAANAVAGGHGRNIVNVILVDFRAFDTLGEALVVVIAALAAIAALGKKHTGRHKKLEQQ